MAPPFPPPPPGCRVPTAAGTGTRPSIMSTGASSCAHNAVVMIKTDPNATHIDPTLITSPFLSRLVPPADSKPRSLHVVRHRTTLRCCPPKGTDRISIPTHKPKPILASYLPGVLSGRVAMTHPARHRSGWFYRHRLGIRPLLVCQGFVYFIDDLLVIVNHTTRLRPGATSLSLRPRLFGFSSQFV